MTNSKKRKIINPIIPKRNFNQMMIEFIMFWKNYVFQSLAATIATMLILIVLSLENAVVIASIAASIFIVFTMPNAISARKRAIMGGHWVGLLLGSIWAIIPHSSSIMSVLVYSMAVGTTMLIMVIFDLEHPPAAGTALGVAITGFSWSIGIAVITSTIMLVIIRTIFKPFLKDLV